MRNLEQTCTMCWLFRQLAIQDCIGGPEARGYTWTPRTLAAVARRRRVRRRLEFGAAERRRVLQRLVDGRAQSYTL